MRIAILLSGGVDSSVALKLLQKQGHELTAYYVKIWLEDEVKHLGDCPWEEDLKYARAVCKQLDVPLEVVSLQREYRDTVIAYTLKELKAGRTPNPDILCNQKIKFGQFLKKLKKLGKKFDKVASGHYAAVVEKNGRFLLKRSPDRIKDQTYFLAYLNQSQLSKIISPLGTFQKSHVRTLARSFDLPTKDRKDSQGICFLGSIRYADFIKHHLGEKNGDIVHITSGKKLGEHNGYWYYTIGQRQGIKLAGGPWYVVAKDVKKNIVYVGHKSDMRNHGGAKTIYIRAINWISRKSPIGKTVGVRIRHGGIIHKARICGDRDGAVTIKLSKSIQGVAPGQFAVLYQGRYCLGGGIIASSVHSPRL